MSLVSDLEFLLNLLKAMIDQDVDLTFRKVVERSQGRFRHASTFTRRHDLRAEVEAAQRHQAAVRKVASKISKSSPAILAERLTAAEAEVRKLKQQRELLVASHRAAILAIGKIGGMKAWREYFPIYSDAISSLQKLEALPETHLVEILAPPPRKTTRS